MGELLSHPQFPHEEVILIYSNLTIRTLTIERDRALFLPKHYQHSPSRAALGRMLLTLVLLVVALSNILVPFLQQRWQRLSVGEPPIDLNMLGWGQDGWIVASLLLLFIGRAVARGKRQAWLLTVALFT